MDELNAVGVGEGASVGDESQSAAPDTIADVPEINSVGPSETPNGAGEGNKQTPAKDNNSLETREDFRRYQAERDRAEALRVQQFEARLQAQAQAIEAERARYRQQFAESLKGVDPETRAELLMQELQRRDESETQTQAQMRAQAQMQAQVQQTAQSVQQLANELGVDWAKARAVIADIDPAGPNAYGLAATRLALLVKGTMATMQKEQPKIQKAAAQNALREAGVMRTSSGAGSGGASLAALEARAKSLEAGARKSDAGYEAWAKAQDDIERMKRGNR